MYGQPEIADEGGARLQIDRIAAGGGIDGRLQVASGGDERIGGISLMWTQRAKHTRQKQCTDGLRPSKSHFQKPFMNRR